MNPDNMEKFELLLGEWNLNYHIPKSFLSEAATETGTGTFKKILDGRYVQFDYSTQSGGKAKGIFAWDDKMKLYRYWWFENSGNFLSATCNFIAEGVLAMNWHDSVLYQTFVKESCDKVILNMQYPAAKGGHDSVMEVVFTREK